jgi:hypothetical protein
MRFVVALVLSLSLSACTCAKPALHGSPVCISETRTLVTQAPTSDTDSSTQVSVGKSACEALVFPDGHVMVLEAPK